MKKYILYGDTTIFATVTTRRTDAEREKKKTFFNTKFK